MTTALVVLLALVSAGDVLDEAAERYEAGECRFTAGTYDDHPLPYRLMRPESLAPGERYPLVLFLHGAGERGEDNLKQLKYLPAWLAEPERRAEFPCFVLAPQCPTRGWWVTPRRFLRPDQEANDVPAELIAVEGLLDEVLAREAIDPDRVYLTGLSMGGFGSWELAARRPEQFAALVPICGGGPEKQAARLVRLPIWAWHGGADAVVPPDRSRRMVEAVTAAGGQVRYTELDGVGHDSWTPAYTGPENVLTWLFAQRRDASQ